jgi:small-conductance mechanosensitive channel
MEWLQSLTWLDVALPVLLLSAGTFAGWFAERVLLRGLFRRAAEATSWSGDNLLVRALRGVALFWGGAVGAYFATLAVSDAPQLTRVLNDAMRVALVWSLVIVSARLVGGSMTSYADRDASLLPATSILPNLAQLAVYVLGVLLVLRQIGVAITPVLTALGVGSLAVALALQSTLTNVFAGLYLIASRTIRPGHYVRLAESEKEGYVTDISWRATTVRTIEDNAVVVPNEKLASGIVTDFYLPQETMQVRVAVGVDYQSDPDHVEEVTLEVAREVVREVSGEHAEASGGSHATPADMPEPKLFFRNFGEFSLNLIVFLRVREFFDQYRLRHLFMKRLIARYDEEGIRIPFPIREFGMELSDETDRGPGRLARPDAQESPAESDAVSFR